MNALSISIEAARQLRAQVEGTPLEQVDPVCQLASEVALQLADAWGNDKHFRAEWFLERHPELREKPEAALRVIYEEICLRLESGETVSPEELHQRFPELREELDVVLAGHDLVAALSPAPLWPLVGETIGEFRIATEIARGGGGRVFLAEDTELAGRRVVIKATGRISGEHLSLARLQHTYIVPLFSVRDFPERRCRLLCMPFLGGTSLKSILHHIADFPPGKRTGKMILDLLRSIGLAANEELVRPTSSHRFFQRAEYVSAVCWIGVCLADALQYAHEQGLVHLDIKPANILITSDAQPMLLDFHLARYPIAKDSMVEDFGGTRAYMSPEQWLAFDAIRLHNPTPVEVGQASDIYSLGLVLVECLGGTLSFDDKQRTRLNWPRDAGVSLGLSDILARCLRHAPSQRYGTAGELAEDLRRHLAQLPLRGVRNRSIAEQWTKWRRRHPQGNVIASMSLLLMIGAGALGLLTWKQQNQQLEQVRIHWDNGRHFADHRNYPDALDSLRKADAAASRTFAGRALQEDVAKDLRRVGRLAMENELLSFVDRIRYLHGDTTLPASKLLELEILCEQAWERYAELRLRFDDATETERLCDLLEDLAILWADFASRSGDDDKSQHKAEAIIERAETTLGVRSVLAWAKGHYARDKSIAAPLNSNRATYAWEKFISGRWLFAAGEFGAAARELDEATQLRPSDFWPWFYLGLCQLRLAQYAEATHSLTVAIALRSDSAECYLHRGNAWGESGRFVEARADYDRALLLQPSLGSALLNRGVLSLKEHKWMEARRDLDRALAFGANPPRVHFHLALVGEGEGDLRFAREHGQRAIELDPQWEDAANLVRRLGLRPAGPRGRSKP